MDRKELKQLQDYFCKIADVFAFCADENGQWQTALSGTEEDVKRIKIYISNEMFDDLIHRITNSTLEEQIVEDTQYFNLKMAAISIKQAGRPVLNWIICGVLSDIAKTPDRPVVTDVQTVLTEKKFYEALDFVRVVSGKVFSARLLVADAEEESRKCKYSQHEMALSLKRIASLTEIVQLLESDDAIEYIMGEILKAVGSYLGISSAQLFALRKDNKMDVMAEWCNDRIISLFDQTRYIPRSPILKYEKPVVISSNATLFQEEEQVLREAHVKATVIMPIFVNGAVSMYAAFNECKQEKIWQISDIKFISDSVKIMQSILVRRIQKNSLASSYASLEAILDNIGSAVYVRDIERGKLLFTNKMLRDVFSTELETGTLQDIFEEEMKQNSRAAGNYEVNYEQKERWYDLHYTNITWVDGKQVVLVALYDITDEKIYQIRIEQQAYTDFLTGLYNRMCCERDLAMYVDQARENNKQGMLLYLDLDDFKNINDGLGHQYGDVLLKAIAHSIQRIEGIGETCYRMGGDEFVILIPPASFMRANLIIDEVTDIFRKPWFLKDADYYCTMSMGSVVFPDEGSNVQDLIKKADIAMYEAKKGGKNRVTEYTDNLYIQSSKRLDMEKNMRDATAAGYKEFEVYYQPIIDIQLEGNPCTGAEALIRWNSAELGFISPSDFIPLAEYLGLINPIGNYVLQEACKACKWWNDNGKPNYKVNVNLSVIQLLQPDIVDIVRNTVEETGINPRNLTLEVTESLAINDMERMREILRSIKMLGVRIALDDFGTGYSSLNHIREIPLDVIKVDQSFVIDLAEDTYSQSFIKMVSELASAIGVSICVEGIETMEQHKILEGMKVRLVQGYYFGRPMKRDDFEAKYMETESKGAMKNESID